MSPIELMRLTLGIPFQKEKKQFSAGANQEYICHFVCAKQVVQHTKITPGRTPPHTVISDLVKVDDLFVRCKELHLR